LQEAAIATQDFLFLVTCDAAEGLLGEKDRRTWGEFIGDDQFFRRSQLLV
jgi:hypothetical protein